MGRDRDSDTRRFRCRLTPVKMGRSLAVIGVGFVLVILGFHFIGPDDGGSVFIEALREMPNALLFGMILGIAGLILLAGFVKRQVESAFMVVEGGGIRCHPPAHCGQRIWTRHEWQLSWDEIERAVVYRPDYKVRQLQTWMMATLALQADSREYRLGLLQWEPEDHALERPQVVNPHMGKVFHPMTENHPLIRMLRDKGVAVDYEPLDYRAMRRMKKQVREQRDEAESRGYVDMMNYPSLVVMLALIALLPLAALLHYVAMPPLRALWDPGYLVPAAVGIGIFFGACLGMRQFGQRVPAREAVVVALMLAVGVAALWNPLNMRFNVLVNGEPESVRYAVEGHGVFGPPEGQYPSIDLADLDVGEYWESLEPGSEHEFVLIRIGTDQFVLSLGELYEKTRAFYSERNAEG